MLIGIAVSSIMIAAMYSSYTIINSSYSRVTDVASISRSGRDIVAMLMRDIRMAGYKYYYGYNSENEALPDDQRIPPPFLSSRLSRKVTPPAGEIPRGGYF